MSRQIRLLTGFLTVGVWTFLSKIFGFVRDIIVAAALGSSPAAQALMVAFALPNMFRQFFAEGAFNTAFVPMFSKKVEADDNAQDFAREAFSGLASIIIIFVLIAQIFMPYLVWAMASGFAADERFDLAVNYGRIAFIYILFISLAALLSGVLNALGRFAAAAAAPVLLNVFLVAAIVFAQINDLDVAKAFIWTVPIGGVAQLALVWFAAKKAGITLIPKLPRLTPEMKSLAIIAAPAALAGGVTQINLLVGRQVASYYDGAIAWLAYADRLNQLPLGVVGIAIGVVLLPDLSRKLRAKDVEGGRYSLNRAAEFSLIITLPAATALVVIATPLVAVLYGRGAFNALDISATAAALTIYGLGLPAFVLTKILAPIYFARADTKRPFIFAVISMLVNLVLVLGLMQWVGFLAAAIGTSLASWAMAGLLFANSRKFEGVALDSRIIRVIPRVIISCLVMGVVLYFSSALLMPYLMAATIRYVALAGLVILGCTVYTAMAFATGALSMTNLRSALKR